MPTRRIDPDLLRRFLEADRSQAQAARHFGVSEAAISQQVRKLRLATSKVVALEKAGALVDDKLSASAQLAQVQRIILEQLAWAEAQTQAPGVDRPKLIDTIVKLTTEVRQGLALQANLTRMLWDLNLIREFQDVVLEAIRSEAPETARRIVARLKELRALRPSADLPTLDGGGTDGLVA
jgi:hypothetical protein